MQTDEENKVLEGTGIETGEPEVKKKSPPKKRLTKTQKLQTELDELKDKYLRRLAEFDNYKKRRSRDSVIAARRAIESTLRTFLPLIDDLHRTLNSAKEHENNDSIIKGLELVTEKFEETLTSHGVEPIDAVGKPFDAEMHEAMMVIEDKDHEPNTVVEELEKGYIYGDRVLRHSKVKVSA